MVLIFEYNLKALSEMSDKTSTSSSKIFLISQLLKVVLRFLTTLRFCMWSEEAHILEGGVPFKASSPDLD